MKLMTKLKKFLCYFTTGEIVLWITSVMLIVVPFCIFDRQNFLTLVVSIIGVTAILFNAKGNPLGQVLMIFFCVVYGIISLEMRYYGETITYLGMSLPMTIFALVTWLKNPFNEKKSQVKINTATKRDYMTMLILAGLVTFAFYFILKHFNTANLVVSTFSVATSFAAAFLVFKRSEYFPLGYMIHDLVLIVLWTLACFTDIKYISVVSCFVAFFLTDAYSFINWSRMKKRQSKILAQKVENNCDNI